MTRIYLAGLESRSLFDRLKKNAEVTKEPPCMLISYLATAWKSRKRKRERSELLEYYKGTFPDARILIDSGAFSFHVNTMPAGTDPEAYFQDYLEWCKRNRDLFHRCVELDLDDIVGEATVHAWRGEMRAEGIDPVYCWGPARGRKGWLEACDDPAIDYMAVGGGWASDPRAANMVRRAQARGKKVHGMGFTETIHGLHRMQYYSVDSTSFLKGQKFGTLFLFLHRRLLQLDTDPAERERVRSRYRRYFESLGLDADAIIGGDYKEVTRNNALAWTLLGQEWSRRLGRKHAPLRATDWPQWALARRAEVEPERIETHGNRVLREVETSTRAERELAGEMEGFSVEEETGEVVYRGPKKFVPLDVECYLRNTQEGTEVVMKKLPWMTSNGGAKKPTEIKKKTIGETVRMVAGPPVPVTTSAPQNTPVKTAAPYKQKEGMKESGTAAGVDRERGTTKTAPQELVENPLEVVESPPKGLENRPQLRDVENTPQAVENTPQAHSLPGGGDRREAGPQKGLVGPTPGEAPGQEKSLGVAIRPVRGTVLSEVSPLRCRGCAKQGECPLFYDAEAEGIDLTDPQNDRVDLCRLDAFFAAELIQDRGGLEHARYEMLNAAYQRLRRGLAFEQMDGGMLDRQVSAEMASFLEQISSVLRETQARTGGVPVLQGGNVSIFQVLLQRHAPAPIIEVENTARKYDPLG